MTERDLAMEEIVKRIRLKRAQLNYSYQDLATLTGMSKSTLQRYESGDIKNIPLSKIKILASALQTTPEWIMGWESNVVPISLPKNTVNIPVLGSIPAGMPAEAVEDIIEWIGIPEEWTHGERQYFGLKVKGDSMFPEYLEGDTVIIRKQPCCESGDDCAVMVNDTEATLKKVHKCGDGLELEAINPMYGKKKFSMEEVKQLPVSILGIVVELRRNKRR